MKHICVSKLTIIGSDNGLSPGRRQAIIWTNAGILLIGPLGANFSEILIEFHTFSLKKMHFKRLSAKWRPFCLGLNVLSCNTCDGTCDPDIKHWIIIDREMWLHWIVNTTNIMANKLSYLKQMLYRIPHDFRITLYLNRRYISWHVVCSYSTQFQFNQYTYFVIYERQGTSDSKGNKNGHISYIHVVESSMKCYMTENKCCPIWLEFSKHYQ